MKSHTQNPHGGLIFKCVYLALCYLALAPSTGFSGSYEVPQLSGWYDYGYAPGKLSMPPTGNEREQDWHNTWPGHEDMFLTPSSCTSIGQALVIDCTQSSCGGGFTCRRDVQCDEGTYLVGNLCYRDDDKICRSGGIGNPCEPSTGNKYQVEADYNGIDISIVRTYNSNNQRDLGFGVGWTMPFGKRLIIGSNGDSIGLERETGRTEAWALVAGIWGGGSNTIFDITESAGNYIVRNKSNNHTETYNSEGKLVEESSAKGKTTTYTYTTDGLLQEVTNHFGHKLALTWEEQPNSVAGYRIITITNSYYSGDPNDPYEGPVDGKYSYSYDTDNNLETVTFPDGATKTYHYENVNFPNHLTGITDENNKRFATFDYDASGRAISTEHAGEEAENPLYPPQEKYQIQYQ